MMRLLLILAMSGLAMACAQAAPLVQAAPDEIELFVEAVEEPQPPAKIPEQPAALVAALKKLQEGTLDAQVKALVEKARQDMVYVEGGEFLMGDFGHLDSVEKLPYTSQPYNKPLHKVVLDSFSISKYKVTYAEYDVYTKAKGLPLLVPSESFHAGYRKPGVPVGVAWQGAKDYCVWLGKVSKLPFALPTEAQWEYAARARGQFLVFPTNDGYYREEINVPSYATRTKLIGDAGFPLLDDGEVLGNSGFVYPVGLYPPNPLGLYDLAHNGQDWVNDWFSEDYYARSPAKNPAGPVKGTTKVLRGLDTGDKDTAMSMHRMRRMPLEPPYKRFGKMRYPTYLEESFRCVVQHTKPLN